MGKVKAVPLILSFVIVIIVAFLGSLFTAPSTGSQWYQQIKPSITPPNFLFPIAWTVLFILIALSLYFIWTSAKKEDKPKIVWIYGINFILNILWSALFFGLRNPVLAFIEIIIFFISIIFMMILTFRIDQKAGWLLVPYLVWVAFALILNLLTFI
jgi:translocator protein